MFLSITIHICLTVIINNAFLMLSWLWLLKEDVSQAVCIAVVQLIWSELLTVLAVLNCCISCNRLLLLLLFLLLLLDCQVQVWLEADRSSKEYYENSHNWSVSKNAVSVGTTGFLQQCVLLMLSGGCCQPFLLLSLYEHTDVSLSVMDSVLFCCIPFSSLFSVWSCVFSLLSTVLSVFLSASYITISICPPKANMNR